MIEKILYDYLNEKLTVPVYMEIPNPIPGRFYLLEKTSGGLDDEEIYRATFALQSYGASLLDSATMNVAGINAMLAAAELDDVSEVNLNSDYNYSDTTRKRHRYQAVFNITHY